MKNMGIGLVFVLGCFFLNAQDETIAQKITNNIRQSVQSEKVIGISAGVIVNDSIVWTFSDGYSDAAEKKGFADNTVSRIASITKPMTAICIFQLIEQGKLQLDDKVSQYIAKFNAPRLRNITVRQVLQHSSGISQYKNNKEANNQKEYTNLEEALAIFIDRDLLFEPGTDFFYTSFGYVVLGLIIENVSGMAYEDYLEKHIFEVAGMKDTSIERVGRVHENKAKIYHQSKPGKIREVTNHNISDRLPGGGVQSTVVDLLKFAKAVLNHEFVSPESFELMITSSGLKKEGNAYGMGWYLYGDNPDFGNIVGHNGAQLGCSSFLFLFPDYDAATIALSNTSGFGEIGNISLSLIKLAEEAKKK